MNTAKIAAALRLLADAFEETVELPPFSSDLPPDQFVPIAPEPSAGWGKPAPVPPPLVAETVPPMPQGLCPVHNTPWRKWVAPGISKKTGAPYSGFWACPAARCDQKPPRVAA